MSSTAVRERLDSDACTEQSWPGAATCFSGFGFLIESLRKGWALGSVRKKMRAHVQ